MSFVDWQAVILGGGVGSVMGALYFVGLAVGMRWALRSEVPVKLLSLSAALRISALLGIGWLVVGQGGPWAGLGYGLTFLAVRFISTAIARLGTPAGSAP